MSKPHSCTFQLPDWAGAFLARQPVNLPTAEDAMQLVIDAAAMNIREGTGGPFAAAVIDLEDRSLVALGVNLVTTSGLSITHAEMVALSLAQQRLGNWNLAEAGRFSLVTSCEPCAMCYGAVPWSGVVEMVCGGRKADAEAHGFDEGDKPDDWSAALARRGIAVQHDVLRAEAAALFDLYRQQGGEIYNAGGAQD